MHKGHCTVYAPRPHCCGFCPLLKKSKGAPYLKIRNFTQFFVADAHMKKRKNPFYHPSKTLWVNNFPLETQNALCPIKITFGPEVSLPRVADPILE